MTGPIAGRHGDAIIIMFDVQICTVTYNWLSQIWQKRLAQMRCPGGCLSSPGSFLRRRRLINAFVENRSAHRKIHVLFHPV